jgi:hypothetical protein
MVVRPSFAAVAVCCGLACLFAPQAVTDAEAQFWRDIGIGARVVGLVPTDSDLGVDSAVSWGGTGGMVPEDGWGPAFSLGWFDAALREDGRSSRTLGRIDVRPVMGGIGYTWVKGPVAITASFTAGVSFNGGSIGDSTGGVGRVVPHPQARAGRRRRVSVHEA